MRVLFVTVPAAGHVFPLVPLVRAVQAEGHEVLVASWDMDKTIESGLQWVNIAPGLNMFAEVLWPGAPAKTALPELWQRVQATWGRDRNAFFGMCTYVGDKVSDALVQVARQWRPDLVVHECLSLHGQVAARAVGVPVVQVSMGFQHSVEIALASLPYLRDAFARHGSEPPDSVEVMHNVPPSMAVDGHGRWGFRPIANSGGGELPGWLLQPVDRPRVAVTLGTTTPLGGYDRLGRVVAAAGEVDAEFVVTLGGHEVSGLGALPANVRSATWLPWDALIRTCTAVVHHGGASVVMSGLAAGLPQLVLPDGADRDMNGAAVAGRGAGIVATADDVDPDLLRRLVSDDKLRAAAADVRAEVAAMPSPAAMVGELVELVRNA